MQAQALTPLQKKTFSIRCKPAASISSLLTYRTPCLTSTCGSRRTLVSYPLQPIRSSTSMMYACDDTCVCVCTRSAFIFNYHPSRCICVAHTMDLSFTFRIYPVRFIQQTSAILSWTTDNLWLAQTTLCAVCSSITAIAHLASCASKNIQVLPLCAVPRPHPVSCRYERAQLVYAGSCKNQSNRELLWSPFSNK